MTADEKKAVEALLWAGAALAMHVRINMDADNDMEREMVDEWDSARDELLKDGPL